MTTTGTTDTAQSAASERATSGAATWLMGMLVTYKAVSEETGGEYMIWEGLVPPQHGAPPHIHHRETEAFYVLDGVFEIIRGEQTVRAAAGDYVHVPRGMAHGFTSVGPAPGRLLGIVTPGGLHELLLPGLGQPAEAPTLPPPPAGPPDLAQITAIARKYDTELLLPPGQ